jgi:hypothetical protein
LVVQNKALPSILGFYRGDLTGLDRPLPFVLLTAPSLRSNTAGEAQIFAVEKTS